MSKPAHPIVKMYCSGESARGRAGELGRDRVRAQIAAYRRHVKPLLDALEQCADWMEEDGCDCGTDEPGTCALCVARRRLSEWMAKR